MDSVPSGLPGLRFSSGRAMLDGVTREGDIEHTLQTWKGSVEPLLAMAFVTDPCCAHSLLTALGLPAAPATFAPARDPPQDELDWEDPA